MCAGTRLCVNSVARSGSSPAASSSVCSSRVAAASTAGWCSVVSACRSETPKKQLAVSCCAAMPRSAPRWLPIVRWPLGVSRLSRRVDGVAGVLVGLVGLVMGAPGR